MKNRIPPPLLTLILAGTMVFLAFKFGEYIFQVNQLFWMSVIPIIVGLSIMIAAAAHFRRQKTTVNPFRPENTSNLVLDGVYKYTRNPMYLGMAFILIGVQIAVGFAPNIILFLFFVLYITQCQIKPEERALTNAFGSEFTDYMNRVRRWI